MSRDATAILLWGIYPDEGDEEDEDVWDWEDKVALAAGHPKPAEPYGEETRESHVAYWTQRAADVADLGCRVRFQGGGDSATPLLAVSASVVLADWGSPVVLDDLRARATAAENPEWEDRLRRFAAALGKRWPEGGARWYLAAYYG
jgi:hypothetical protein